MSNPDESKGVKDQITDFGSSVLALAQQAALTVAQKVKSTTTQLADKLADKAEASDKRIEEKLNEDPLEVLEKNRDGYEPMKEKALDMADRAKEKIVETYQTAKNAVTEFANKDTEQKKESFQAMGTKAKEFVASSPQKAKDGFVFAKDKIAALYEKARGIVADKSENLADKSKEVAEVTEEKATELTENVEDKIRLAYEASKEKARELEEDISDTPNRIRIVKNELQNELSKFRKREPEALDLDRSPEAVPKDEVLTDDDFERAKEKALNVDAEVLHHPGALFESAKDKIGETLEKTKESVTNFGKKFLGKKQRWLRCDQRKTFRIS